MRLASKTALYLVLASAAAKQDPRALAVGASIEGRAHLAAAAVEDGQHALAYPAQRIWRVDDELAIATVGVAADARAVARAAKVLCLEHRATYSTPLPPARLAAALGARFAAAAAGDRSLGVDVVVAGAGAVATVSAGGRVRTGRAAVAGGAETPARRRGDDALVASIEAGAAPADVCATALAAADLS